MRGSTFLLEPSSFDHQNAGKISLFVSLSPFSLSLLLVLSFSLFPLFFFFPNPPALFSFVCPSPHLLFHFLLFSLFLFHFLFSISFSSFSLFYFSFGLTSPELPKSEGNFPLLSSIATCHHHHFSLFFFLYSTLDTRLNVSHPSKFVIPHGYHAMCHSPRVPCGIHIIMSYVT